MSRFKQAYLHLFGRLKASDREWVASMLDGREYPFFENMHRADRFHCCRVARSLEAIEAPLYVLKAALLHDCGKPSSYGLLARSLAIFGFPSPIKKNHPSEGAKKLEGFLPRESLDLIRRHHEKKLDELPWLAELVGADNLH